MRPSQYPLIISFFFFLMIRRPPRSTQGRTLFPYTPLFRSLFEWLEFPGRKALGSLIALPAVLPPFVGVLAFLFLYGESGFVARAVQAVFGLRGPPWRLQRAGAILLVHAYSMYVYFYLLTRGGLARSHVSTPGAAQAMAAGWGEPRRQARAPPRASTRRAWRAPRASG